MIPDRELFQASGSAESPALLRLGMEMNPTFFKSASAFRTWLADHHASSRELWIGFYKKDSGRDGIRDKAVLDALALLAGLVP